MTSLLLCLPFSSSTSRFRYRPARCASGRQSLFNRIALVYDNVTGLDFSKDQLSMASSRQDLLSKPCYKNIEWVEGDALHLPFSACFFNAITMGYGLRNVVDRRKAFEEMFRVLKPGSRISVLDFNKSTRPITTTIQEWMINIIVVPVASGYCLAEEYEYLNSSIKEFLTGKEQEKLALDVGFSTAKHYEISGGLMGNLVAMR